MLHCSEGFLSPVFSQGVGMVTHTVTITYISYGTIRIAFCLRLDNYVLLLNF